MITIENFESAGYETQTFGKQNRFKRNIQSPWVFRSDSELNLISILDGILSKYAVIESTSMGGIHRARIIDNKLGDAFDIEIHNNHIKVYPTKTEHRAGSNKLRNLLSRGLI